MKIRNRDRKIDIEEIIISKYDNKTKVLIIINGQAITWYINSTYTKNVFDSIEKYFQVLGDDTYVRI